MRQLLPWIVSYVWLWNRAFGTRPSPGHSATPKQQSGSGRTERGGAVARVRLEHDLATVKLTIIDEAGEHSTYLDSTKAETLGEAMFKMAQDIRALEVRFP